MTYSTDTQIVGEPQGSATAFINYAIARGSKRIEEVTSYIETVYDLAPKLGFNPAVLIGQSILETSINGVPWASPVWAERLNPAGIGWTGNPEQNAASRIFANGEEAARAHLAHMWAYTNGSPNIPGGLVPLEDPRWQNVIRAGWAGTVTTIGDLTNKWADDNRYGEKIAERLNELVTAGILEEGTSVALVFHKTPHPGFVDMTYISRNKIEGIGWDNLGQRKPRFIVLHRMYGTLRGTDSYFAPADSPHLTDYAIGVEGIDGKALAGEIHKYNDPTGYRSGWASGRVSAPYGDGKAIVDKYGINAVNRDGVSIELSGYWTTPVDSYSWSEYVKLIAYWVDYMEIPYASLPLNPHTGINTFIWHQEFTIGTGKVCPGQWLMDRTSQLYKDVAAYLKPFQEGTDGGEAPPVEPPPAPTYAKPIPVPALVAVTDKEATAGVTDALGNRYILVNDRVKAIRPTARRQTALPGSASTGPDLKVDEEFPVTYLMTTTDGDEFYVTDYWTHILVEDTVRLSDSREG